MTFGTAIRGALWLDNNPDAKDADLSAFLSVETTVQFILKKARIYHMLKANSHYLYSGRYHVARHYGQKE